MCADRAAARPGVLEEIRTACREVCSTAELVHIDDVALHRLIAGFDAEPPSPAYPGAYFRGDTASTVAYVLTLETLNFGSGWFDEIRKRPGSSGHLTIAASLTDRSMRGELWTADQLTSVTAGDCAAVFSQATAGPAFELMGWFATALNDLGELLLSSFAGSPVGLVEAAGHSAEALLLILDQMPLFRDVGELDGRVVPFYKRAQICSATLSLAFGNEGIGRFDDLDRLTMFADNLVPHVLWCEGALRFDADLARRIAARDVLPAGGREEIELRAGAVEAVERIVAGVRERGRPVTAMAVDEALWSRGQRPDFKAKPRPRIRTTAF